jgi:ubiquilin
MSEITIQIKCSNSDKAEIKIEPSATVLNLKEKVADALKVPAGQQRLIYKGRVLKDELTIENYEVQDGHTVHMVKGAAANAASAASNPTPASNPAPGAYAAPNPAGSMPNPFAPNFNNNPNAGNPMNNPFGGGAGGANPLAGMGGAGGMPDLNRMQAQLMQNPEVMQQIMNSPMMADLMNNPDMMRNMMLNNPQMQQMLDANPQIRHILNDPAVIDLLFSVSIIL